MRQMPGMSGRSEGQAGEARPGSDLDEAALPPRIGNDTGAGLLEAALRRENLLQAWKQVRANKCAPTRGAAGVDGLDIDQTAAALRISWPAIRDSLREGTYRPQPVRRVMIPKPGGGERELGIPTVLDRLIQQALLQVLQPILDPTFSQHSYGFRPGRSAHDAVLELDEWMRHRVSNPAQTMEAWHDDLPRTAGKGGKPSCGTASGSQGRSLVAQQRQTPQQHPHHQMGRPTRNAQTRLTSISRTARCGSACRVVWQGRDRIRSPPMPI
ncbi:reverse transcriptase (RNA-dependent DNA polymerase) [Rhizobium sp. BK068]|nr:reverse transcriptase (RNA-dependent DNA polymerase) [Rhizobium sp. BK068]